MTRPTEVTTPPVRLSFTDDLFVPQPVDKKNPNSEKVFSCQILLPKDFDLSSLKTALNAALRDKFGDKKLAPDKRAANGSPIHSVEEARDDETGELPPGMEEGGHYIRAKTRFQPQVVDRQAQPITDKARLYSGCYCSVHLNAHAWDYGGKWGVSLGLEAVQFVRDGERLGGRRPATDVFKPLEGAAPLAAQGEAKSDTDSLFG